MNIVAVREINFFIHTVRYISQCNHKDMNASPSSLSSNSVKSNIISILGSVMLLINHSCNKSHRKVVPSSNAYFIAHCMHCILVLSFEPVHLPMDLCQTFSHTSQTKVSIYFTHQFGSQFHNFLLSFV